MNIYGPFFSEAELHLADAPEDAKEKMLLLVKLGLNPVRKKFGPVIVTSGFRSPAKHKELEARGYAPAKASQHLTGEAVDFIVRGVESKVIFEWLKEWWPGQIIHYTKRGHVHIALPNIDRAKRGVLYGWTTDS